MTTPSPSTCGQLSIARVHRSDRYRRGVQRITHLGRTLSLGEPTHRWLASLVGLGAVAGWARPGSASPAEAMFRTAATIALVWMLIRELGPDGQKAALAGAAVAGLAVVYTGDTELAALAGLALASRVLTRSTGRVPLITDIVAIGVFAGVFARTPLAWTAGLAVAAAVALDTGLPRPAPDRYVWLAAAIGVSVTVTAVISGAVYLNWMRPYLLTLSAGVVAWVVLLRSPSTPRTLDDHGREFVPTRIRSARLLALGAVTLGTLVGGAAFATGSWPLWVGLAFAAVPR